MNSIQNFLSFLNDNWTYILVCIGLIVSIAMKTMNYFNKSDNERVEIAKTQIKETMLKMISDAEERYETMEKAGSIKRSQVIEKIFEQYPILTKVLDQEELIGWIDNEIDNSLKTLRKVIEFNRVEIE